MISITTSRLILRSWQESDIEPFYQINQDRHVIEYLAGSLTYQQVRGFIDKHNQQLKQRGYTLWAVELKHTGELIGFVGLNLIDFDLPFTPAVEIGWRLGSQYWGQGYATEAAQAALDYGFNKCGLTDIVSFTNPANQRSIRLMERLGMQRDQTQDFYHPRLAQDHPLAFHVVYRSIPISYESKA